MRKVGVWCFTGWCFTGFAMSVYGMHYEKKWQRNFLKLRVEKGYTFYYDDLTIQCDLLRNIRYHPRYEKDIEKHLDFDFDTFLKTQSHFEYFGIWCLLGPINILNILEIAKKNTRLEQNYQNAIKFELRHVSFHNILEQKRLNREKERLERKQEQKREKKRFKEHNARISKSTPSKLYHQTSHERSDKIIEDGMRCGNSGSFGGGIYFASVPSHTNVKTTMSGVILECDVTLGNILSYYDTPTENTNFNLERSRRRGYDSVHTSYFSSGPEYVVYNSEQVKNCKIFYNVHNKIII